MAPDTPEHGLPPRYVDVTLVARGGMGEVWRARDAQLDRLVAIKVLRDQGGGEPPATLRTRFEREARSIAQLSAHRSIVTVYDVAETADGLPFLTMQWLGGGSLREHAEGAAHERVAAWIEQAADGLDAAHRAGIVHRDVKPGNILLDEQGDAHVADFGIALVQDELAAQLTQTGAVVGTASYMSPEQAVGAPAVPASDQYSLASIAYELLAGRRPFQREGAVAELAAHVSEEPTAPSRLRRSLPADVDAVFARALAKSPDDRFDSCAAFAAALTRALTSPADVTAATVRTPLAGAATAPTRVLPPRRATDLDDPAARPNRLRLLLAVAAIVVLGLAAVGLASRGSHDNPASETQRTTPTSPVNTTATTPAATPIATTAKPTRAEAIAMHEHAFELLQQGRYAEALTEAKAALALLGGVSPYEAYANYNVGAALVGLGRCDEALPYLQRSEELQGQRAEIDAARAQCTSPGKPAKGHGKVKGHKG